jgi:hypothetical protein
VLDSPKSATLAVTIIPPSVSQVGGADLEPPPRAGVGGRVLVDHDGLNIAIRHMFGAYDGQSVCTVGACVRASGRCTRFIWMLLRTRDIVPWPTMTRSSPRRRRRRRLARDTDPSLLGRPALRGPEIKRRTFTSARHHAAWAPACLTRTSPAAAVTAACRIGAATCRGADGDRRSHQQNCRGRPYRNAE